MAAKYLVNVPPGAQVTGVGFVRMGNIFTAPSDDYVPSRRFRAVNEEASKALEKLKAEIATQAKTFREKEKTAHTPEAKQQAAQRAKVLEEQAEQLDTSIFAPAAPAPKVEAGLSMQELDAMNRAGQLDGESREQVVAQEKKAAPAPAPSGKRAADK